MENLKKARSSLRTLFTKSVNRVEDYVKEGTMFRIDLNILMANIELKASQITKLDQKINDLMMATDGIDETIFDEEYKSRFTYESKLDECRCTVGDILTDKFQRNDLLDTSSGGCKTKNFYFQQLETKIFDCESLTRQTQLVRIHEDTELANEGSSQRPSMTEDSMDNGQVVDSRTRYEADYLESTINLPNELGNEDTSVGVYELLKPISNNKRKSIENKKACGMCIGRGHQSKSCTMKAILKCNECWATHWRLMCNGKPQAVETTNNNPTNLATISSAVVESKTRNLLATPAGYLDVTLCTMIIRIVKSKNSLVVRVAIDSHRNYLQIPWWEREYPKIFSYQKWWELKIGWKMEFDKFWKCNRRLLLLKDLRQRFRIEYLTQLPNRQGDKEARPIELREIVLMADETKKKINWPLPRVIEIYPGNGNKVRVAKVKAGKSILLRPVKNLIPLEIRPGELIETGFGPVVESVVSPPSNNKIKVDEKIIDPVEKRTKSGRLVKSVDRFGQN